MGITTLNDPSQYGLSLVLGGGDVTPLDMATVYATLDNNGIKIEPRAILKVTNRDGKDITKNTQSPPQQVLDPRIAYMLTNIMDDNNARLPEFPLNGPLELANGRPAAAKTGTTNDFDDNWTIGYTPQIVTAVWVGNADHTPMQNVDGITGAAPIWHNYMEMATANLPIENFPVPSGITMLNVCSDGGLAPAGAPGSYPEAFMSSNLPARQ
jgi:membrane peptidoglycan carboxypeptidase